MSLRAIFQGTDENPSQIEETFSTIIDKLDSIVIQIKQGSRFQEGIRTLENILTNVVEPMINRQLNAEMAEKLTMNLRDFVKMLGIEEKNLQNKSLSQRISNRFSGKKNSVGTESKRQSVVEELSTDIEQALDEDVKMFAETTSPEEKDLKSHSKSGLQWAARMQTGFEGNLTEEQKADLEKFREIMFTTEYKEDILKCKDGPDRLLLRFLRSECSKKRHFNISKSQKRLEVTMAWRRKLNVDDLLDNPPPEFERFWSIFGVTETVDKEGRLVVFTKAGMLANYMNPHEFSNEVWERCIACMSERRMQFLREESERRGYEVSSTVMVFDMRGGISLGARRMVPFVKVVNSVGATHYPELVDIIYVAAAPGVFNMLFSLISPFLDSFTKEKIKIYSNSSSDATRYVNDLKSHISEDVLPAEYGGSDSTPTLIPAHAQEKGAKPLKPFKF